MKKILAIALVLVLSIGVLAGCTGKKNDDSKNSTGESSSDKIGGTLNLFTWASMFTDEFIANFKKETGVTINYTNFDTDETMLSKLESAKGGTYDVIIANDYIIELAIEKGLAQKIDKSKVSTFSNINPLYQSQFFDKTNDYTVPYGAGVQTIVYNPDTVDFAITKYADLWDSRLKGKIGLTSNFRVMNGMALKVLGKSYNTEDKSEIEAAGKELVKLAPNIRMFKDDSLQVDLLKGEIDVAVMYTSQVTLAKISNPKLKVVYPEEGIGFGIMAGFIPSQAPNSAAAHKFFEYLLDPKVSAKEFESLGYYSTNKAAEEFISDSMKDLLTLPKELNTANMEMIGNISAEALDAHNIAWNKFVDATS